MTLADLLQKGVRDPYTKMRGKLAEFADVVGGQTAGGMMDENADAHVNTSKNLTKLAGKVLPPHMAANVVDLLGLGNQAFAGSLQKLAGKPFFQSGGFDWADVASNRQGQDAGIAELMGGPAPAGVSTVAGASLGGSTLADLLAKTLAGRGGYGATASARR